MVEKIKTFFSDVAKEMKKVSWPTKEQLRESSVVVVIATIIFTIFTYIIDWVVMQAIGFIF